jgi:hypothetical protein
MTTSFLYFLAPQIQIKAHYYNKVWHRLSFVSLNSGRNRHKGDSNYSYIFYCRKLLYAEFSKGESSVVSYAEKNHFQRKLIVRKCFRLGDAVMYLNLDGGNGGEACPSIADSAAVSLSQVSILSNLIPVKKFSNKLFPFNLGQIFITKQQTNLYLTYLY